VAGCLSPSAACTVCSVELVRVTRPHHHLDSSRPDMRATSTSAPSSLPMSMPMSVAMAAPTLHQPQHNQQQHHHHHHLQQQQSPPPAFHFPTSSNHPVVITAEAANDHALLRRKRPRSPSSSGNETRQLMSFARLAGTKPAMTMARTHPPKHVGPKVLHPMHPVAAPHVPMQQQQQQQQQQQPVEVAAPRNMALPGMSELLNACQKRGRPQETASVCTAVTTSAGSSHPAAYATVEQAPMQAVNKQRIDEEGSYIGLHDLPRVYAVPVPSEAGAMSTVASETASYAGDDELEDKTPWPSATQYHSIFGNMANGKIPIYDLGLDPRGVPLHPEFIYSEPVSCMYFLKCQRLLGKGSFGFPRKKKASPDGADALNKKSLKGKKESSKDFEWRKMSFVTGLPKKQPLVRYITATCYSRATDVSAKKKVFRMHAVMLADPAGNGERGDYVLVHIRAGGSKRVGLRTAPSEPEQPLTPNQQPTTQPKTTSPFGPSPQRPDSPGNETSTVHAPSTAAPRFAEVREARVSPPNKAIHQHEQSSNDENDPTVANAKQMLRSMLMQSCSSRDEMAKYVLVLQEELASMQQQTP
ncbi:TPA: hypothetical protein N0F65_010711, partial [Lagenidium giganteum]